MKILIVEDDSITSTLLSQLLLARHYVVDIALDGQTGFELAMAWQYDLIVLDWLMPGLDGVSVCRQLREQGQHQPILLLTSRDRDRDVVAGLDAGADDYVTKPFHADTLLARIRALLRRGLGPSAPPTLCWGQLHLDLAAAEVTYAGQLLALTPKEFALLELFLRHPKRVFSRSAIIDRLWSIDASPSEGAVTNLMKDLRRKLKKAGLVEDVIETVYGLGYRLQSVTAGAGATAAAAGEQLPTSSPAGLASLQQTLERFQPTVRQQVAALEYGLQQLEQVATEPAARRDSEVLAHKLSGSLGVFGFGAASELAGEIEQRLRSQPLGPADCRHLQQLMVALKAAMQPSSKLAQPEPVQPPVQPAMARSAVPKARRERASALKPLAPKAIVSC